MNAVQTFHRARPGRAEQVLVLSRAGEQTVPVEHRAAVEALASTRYLVTTAPPGPLEAARLLADVTVLGATNVALPRFDTTLLDACPSLRSVVLYATGYEHVDTTALAERGITLSVLPAYATRAVAEHALALLLSLAARVHLANDRSRGRADPHTSLRGVELGGRALGIVGVGRIGRRLASLARGIGMTVLGCDIDPAARRAAREDGIDVVSHADLYAAGHAVAVCASTSPQGGPIIDRAVVPQLVEGALVVNVGRPVLVDTDAIVAAVRSRRVRGYAVDDVVLDPVLHADLIDEGRVLQTGHSAWWRDDVLARGAAMFGDSLLAAVQGAPTDVVTPTARPLSLEATG